MDTRNRFAGDDKDMLPKFIYKYYGRIPYVLQEKGLNRSDLAKWERDGYLLIKAGACRAAQ